MALIEMNFANGGGTINPTLIKEGYYATNATITQQIDISKTYMVSFSANAAGSSSELEVVYIKNGVVTYLYDNPNITQTFTINNGVLSFTNPSSSYGRSYCIAQLD